VGALTETSLVHGLMFGYLLESVQVRQIIDPGTTG
jgi:hypothetical protein